jgi:hypothetical protein
MALCSVKKSTGTTLHFTVESSNYKSTGCGQQNRYRPILVYNNKAKLVCLADVTVPLRSNVRKTEEKID